jgi:anaerobic selenocysteine-containing dehydrogenase
MEVKYSVCPHDCPDSCAWRIEFNNGEIKQISGDPEHPVTQGMICEKARSYSQRVFGKDRILFPMKRTGPKGSGNFKQISWEEALQEITFRWNALIQEYGPECILPYSYAGTEGIINKASMDRRFFNALGSSQLERTICSAAGSMGYQLSYGESKGVNPLLTEESQLIIFWGINAFETNIHQVMLASKARKKGAKIITIDVHRNKTAQWADDFYQILPGSDGALALGIAHILFRDGLEDIQWINENVYGVEIFRETVRDYTPDRVAKITGLAPDAIEKLAYDYATVRPSLIRIGNGLQHHDNGGMSTWAIACLPALTGAWKDKGGGLIKFNSGYFEFDRSRLEKPELLKGTPRVINMNQLGKALTEVRPPIYSLFVYNSNPALVAPDQSKVLQGLGREDLFTVVHEQVWTDTARFADIVLPATTHLEHSDLYMSYWHGILQWAEPVLPPQGESKSNIELFQELAWRMGFKESCFTDSTEDIAKDVLNTSYWQEQGITLERLKEKRFVSLNLSDYPFKHGLRKTPSGKIELSSNKTLTLGLSNVPVHVPLVEGPETRNPSYPLTLISPPHHNLLNSTFGNSSMTAQKDNEPFLEIHPEDARMRSITDGESVLVYNSRGSCGLKVRVSDNVLQGVVVAPGVWWLDNYLTGYGINTLTSERLSDMGKGATFFSCLVEVKKAND